MTSPLEVHSPARAITLNVFFLHLVLQFIFGKPIHAFQVKCYQQDRPYCSPVVFERQLMHPKWAVGRSNLVLHHPSRVVLALSEDPDDDGDEKRQEIFVSDASGQDWRDYRAKLVLQEQKPRGSASGNSNEIDGGGQQQQYVYESGQVIEKGSILLAKPTPLKFALRQQYFHKAVILVLEHDEKLGTKGIILNRPSGLVFTESTGEGSFRVWHGGEVDGIHSLGETDFMCLHSIMRSDAADVVSKTVIKDIKEITFDDAKQLTAAGEANPSDFWLFAGYCGWSPGQLQKELERQTWIMVVTDSQTVLNQLQKQSANVEPRAAGLDTWSFLMKTIGRDDSDASFLFEDSMLKEWVSERLLSRSAYTHARIDSLEPQLLTYESGCEGDNLVVPGQIVCASTQPRSPFILSEQDMHKSVILITSDNIHGTFGVFLNRPTANMVDLSVTMKDSNRMVNFPFMQRYGGSYVVYGGGEQPLFWAHCNETLRKARVGFPLSASGEGIWECFAQQVASAIGSGLAVPEDFVTVTGGFIWTKFQNGTVGGLQGEIRDGKFEVVPSSRVQEIWDMMLSQKPLSGDAIDETIDAGNHVWSVAADTRDNRRPGGVFYSKRTEDNVIKEENCVFDSNMTVSTLADMALKHWITMYGLCDDPAVD